MGGLAGAMVGRLGDRAGLRPRDRLVRPAQLALQGLQLGPQRGAALLGDLAQIVVDRRRLARAPVGLEPAADRVDAAGQVEVQAVEVEIAGSLIAWPITRSRTFRGIRSILADPRSPGGRGVSGEEVFQRGALGGGDWDDELAIGSIRHTEQPRGGDGETEREPAFALRASP